MTPRRTRHLRQYALGFAAVSVIALTMSTARADDPPRPWLAQPPATPAAAPAPAPAPLLPWRASLLVGVSAALGAAAVWVRSRKGGLAKLTSSRELRVISSVRVGPKGHLVLAGIGDRAILLGVTDSSVRRIAWMPADQIAAPLSASTSTDVPRVEQGANASSIGDGATRAAVSVSGRAPARLSTSGAPSKGAFAEILRKLGGRHVDAPPAVEDLSPAATLAEMRRDTVQWSQRATNVVEAPRAVSVAEAPRAVGGTGTASDGDPHLEQQAAGILKHRSRRRV
jgi:flagellar biogenesis protein FliO